MAPKKKAPEKARPATPKSSKITPEHIVEALHRFSELCHQAHLQDDTTLIAARLAIRRLKNQLLEEELLLDGWPGGEKMQIISLQTGLLMLDQMDDYDDRSEG